MMIIADIFQLPAMDPEKVLPVLCRDNNSSILFTYRLCNVAFGGCTTVMQMSL